MIWWRMPAAEHSRKLTLVVPAAGHGGGAGDLICFVVAVAVVVLEMLEWIG